MDVCIWMTLMFDNLSVAARKVQDKVPWSCLLGLLRPGHTGYFAKFSIFDFAKSRENCVT